MAFWHIPAELTLLVLLRRQGLRHTRYWQALMALLNNASLPIDQIKITKIEKLQRHAFRALRSLNAAQAQRCGGCCLRGWAE